MKIFYWKSKHGNFGDDLNEFLWPHFIPDVIEQVSDDVLLVGVGTVLSDIVPKGGTRVVLGSGMGYGRLPDDLGDPSWRFFAVRGPLTARMLGDPSLAVADPAILLPLMPDFRSDTHGKVIFVPHWTTSLAGHWQQACAEAGIEFVDPCGEARSVIGRIAGASLVIAESMHGAIVADAFRVPWIATVGGHPAPLKWYDWAMALGIDYRPIDLGYLGSTWQVVKDRLKRREPRHRPLPTPEQAAEKFVSASSTRPSATRIDRPPTMQQRLQPVLDASARLVLGDDAVARHGAAFLRKIASTRPSLSSAAILAEKQDMLQTRMDALRAALLADRVPVST